MKLKRYLKLIKSFFLYVLSRETEFRTNFLVSFSIGFGWFILFMIGFQVIFQHTDQLLGWTKWQVVFLLALSYFFEDLVNTGFREGVMGLPADIVKGNIDGILVKPVDPQFYISFRKISPIDFFDACFSLTLLAVITYHAGLFVSWNAVAGFALLLVSGLVIAYGVAVTLASLAFWWQGIENIRYLFIAVTESGKYPLDVLGKLARPIVLTILPVMVMVNFPAQAFFGRLEWYWYFYSFALAGVWLWGSRKFFLFALRHYSSASS